MFYQERDALRRRLQEGLVAKRVVPPGTNVHIFGSTANGFGTKTSDMDMCITPPPGIEIAEDARPKLIENIAAALEQLGMADVEPRSTARIPYVSQSTLTCISIDRNVVISYVQESSRGDPPVDLSVAKCQNRFGFGVPPLAVAPECSACSTC